MYLRDFLGCKNCGTLVVDVYGCPAGVTCSDDFALHLASGQIAPEYIGCYQSYVSTCKPYNSLISAVVISERLLVFSGLDAARGLDAATARGEHARLLSKRRPAEPGPFRSAGRPVHAGLCRRWLRSRSARGRHCVHVWPRPADHASARGRVLGKSAARTIPTFPPGDRFSFCDSLPVVTCTCTAVRGRSHTRVWNRHAHEYLPAAAERRHTSAPYTTTGFPGLFLRSDCLSFRCSRQRHHPLAVATEVCSRSASDLFKNVLNFLSCGYATHTVL